MADLTDLEICKRIAEIEGLDTNKDILNEEKMIVVPSGDFRKIYNPLTDDGLCFRLLVKHNIDLIAPYLPDGSLVWEAQIFINGRSDALSEYSESPSKAVCLAIIEAHQ